MSNTITDIGADVVMARQRRRAAAATCTSTGATVAALREHRQRQRELRLAAGPAWDTDDDWVLTDELGGCGRNGCRRGGRVLMDTSDLSRIRLDDVRHTHATLALKAGVHPKVVSERLGHATVGITLDPYSHIAPSLAKDAAEQIMSDTYGDDTLDRR